jgi:hypothetical protein
VGEPFGCQSHPCSGIGCCLHGLQADLGQWGTVLITLLLEEVLGLLQVGDRPLLIAQRLTLIRSVPPLP